MTPEAFLRKWSPVVGAHAAQMGQELGSLVSVLRMTTKIEVAEATRAIERAQHEKATEALVRERTNLKERLEKFEESLRLLCQTVGAEPPTMKSVHRRWAEEQTKIAAAAENYTAARVREMEEKNGELQNENLRLRAQLDTHEREKRLQEKRK